MKHLDKIGFTSLLIGTAGMPESYMIPKHIAACMILIIIGCLMILIGDLYNDTQNYKRNNHSDSNVLDRLYFLKK